MLSHASLLVWFVSINKRKREFMEKGNMKKPIGWACIVSGIILLLVDLFVLAEINYFIILAVIVLVFSGGILIGKTKNKDS